MNTPAYSEDLVWSRNGLPAQVYTYPLSGTIDDDPVTDRFPVVRAKTNWLGGMSWFEVIAWGAIIGAVFYVMLLVALVTL